MRVDKLVGGKTPGTESDGLVGFDVVVEARVTPPVTWPVALELEVEVGWLALGAGPYDPPDGIVGRDAELEPPVTPPVTWPVALELDGE